MKFRASRFWASFQHRETGLWKPELFVLWFDAYMLDAHILLVTSEDEGAEFGVEMFELPFGAVSDLKTHSASISSDLDFKFSKRSRSYWNFAVQRQVKEKI